MTFAWRSPKLNRFGGLYIRVWGKWYRVFAWQDARTKDE